MSQLILFIWFIRYLSGSKQNISKIGAFSISEMSLLLVMLIKA